jgi:hypothetical protein
VGGEIGGGKVVRYVGLERAGSGEEGWEVGRCEGLVGRVFI